MEEAVDVKRNKFNVGDVVTIKATVNRVPHGSENGMYRLVTEDGEVIWVEEDKISSAN